MEKNYVVVILRKNHSMVVISNMIAKFLCPLLSRTPDFRFPRLHFHIFRYTSPYIRLCAQFFVWNRACQPAFASVKRVFPSFALATGCRAITQRLCASTFHATSTA